MLNIFSQKSKFSYYLRLNNSIKYYYQRLNFSFYRISFILARYFDQMRSFLIKSISINNYKQKLNIIGLFADFLMIKLFKQLLYILDYVKDIYNNDFVILIVLKNNSLINAIL